MLHTGHTLCSSRVDSWSPDEGEGSNSGENNCASGGTLRGEERNRLESVVPVLKCVSSVYLSGGWQSPCDS